MDKRILVIDDLRLFNDFDPNETWYARDSAEAIKLILSKSYTETWFDHDLGGSDTAMKVVEFIERKYHTEGWIPNLGVCYVHTANPVGANHLMAALSKLYETKRVDVLSMNVGTIEV